MTRPHTEGRVVAHFGPGGDIAGGMASVLRSYAAMRWDRWHPVFVTTYSPDAALWSLGPSLRAAGRLLRRATRPDVVQVHLSHRGSFVREGAIAALAARLGIPVVLSLHGSDLPVFAPEHPRLCRSVFRQADEILVLGEELAALVRHYTPDAAVTLVANPVDLVDAPPGPAAEPVALFGGEISTRKGVDVLLAAWPDVRRRCPQARLVLAGPAHPSLDLSQSLPDGLPDGVTWLGALPHAEFLTRLEQARLLVLPSRLEAMPIAILEAMARAVPVVATSVGAVPDTVGDGGTIVEPGDAPPLAEALVGLLADLDQARAAGQLGLRRCEDRHAEPVLVAALEQTYDRVTRVAPVARGSR
jgi:glycosyltransferase involved in cell wall biosynthesis